MNYIYFIKTKIIKHFNRFKNEIDIKINECKIDLYIMTEFICRLNQLKIYNRFIYIKKKKTNNNKKRQIKLRMRIKQDKHQDQ